MTSDSVYADLAEARPEEEDTSGIYIADSPLLPGIEERSPVEVADGYVTPEKPDFTGDIRDYPELAGAEEGEAGDGKPVSEDLETIIPEYDENIEVALEPAEVRPPVLIEEDTALTGPEPAAAAEVKQPGPLMEVPARIVMATKLQQQRHYLQLGAYREKNSAISAAGRLEEGYPVTIFSDAAGETVSYKLLLGPLTSDESGILLYNFRAGGYSDAFIRRIE
jgi:hypothetical protein